MKGELRARFGQYAKDYRTGKNRACIYKMLCYHSITLNQNAEESKP